MVLTDTDDWPTATQLFGALPTNIEPDGPETPAGAAPARHLVADAVVPLMRIAVVALSKLMAALSPDVDRQIKGAALCLCMLCGLDCSACMQSCTRVPCTSAAHQRVVCVVYCSAPGHPGAGAGEGRVAGASQVGLRALTGCVSTRGVRV